MARLARNGFMDNPTYVVLSRLTAQQRAMDVTAVNIANADTGGYKSERVLFTDWLQRQSVAAAPRGGTVVAYTQDRATYRDQQQGELTHTTNPLDIAITGEGFFTVDTPRGPRLTRAGRFQLMPDGTVSSANGDALLDTNGRRMQLSPADTQISVAGDGTISSENGQIGKIGIVQPDDPMQLQAEGAQLFRLNGATTPVAVPKLLQGALEKSNVQPVLETTRMMNDLREFQFASEFLQGESDRRQGAIDKILTPRS
jgi:flagellar basal-body rod protein FlgF